MASFKCEFYTYLVATVAALAMIRPVTSKDHGWPRPPCWDEDQPDANVTCRVGEDGPLCGNTVCLDDEHVDCIKGRCRCRDPPYCKGDGTVVCATRDEHVCYMVSDPRMRVFSGGRVDVPISCKVLLSSFETDILDILGNDVGQCLVESFTWGVKGRGVGRRGKHFTGGMEIIFTVAYAGTVYYHATRINGEGYDGVYRFSEQGTTVEGGAYGYAVETHIDGLGTIETHYGSEHNTVVEVRADFCGVRMGFRPAEFLMPKEVGQLDPGVFLKVQVVNARTFSSGLCLSPTETIRDQIDELVTATGKEDIDAQTAIMYRVLKTAPNQNFRNAPPLLQAFANTAKECKTTPLVCAIKNCMFATAYPKFMKCYGKTYKKKDEDTIEDEAERDRQLEIERMNTVLLLMHRCFQSFCAPSSMICEMVQEMVEDSSCGKYILLGATTIMDYDCSKLNSTPDAES